MPVFWRCPCQRIAVDGATPKRAAAARQLIPSSIAARSRERKSIERGRPIHTGLHHQHGSLNQKLRTEGNNLRFKVVENRSKAPIFRSWLASPDVNDFSFTSIRRNLLECNRVNLIGLAQDGIVSGDELEALARTWGIRPFAQKPSEEEYQPQRYPYWTLPMVITWIAFRDMDAVREQINDYRKASWDWQRAERRIPIDGGKFWHTVIADELVSDRPASVADLSLKEALAEAQDDHGKIVSIKSAREALWTNLALGKLTASALDAFGSITTVPAHEWPYLDLAYELAGPDYVVGSLNPTKSVYSDVKLAQVEVTKVWTAAADAKKPASIDLRKWLVGQMRDSPEVRLKPKSDYLEIAQKTYGVSKAAFDREWVFALEQVPNAKPFWTKAGRPKKVRK